MMATTGIDLALPGLASDSFSAARMIGHYTRVPRQTSAQNPHRGISQQCHRPTSPIMAQVYIRIRSTLSRYSCRGLGLQLVNL
jgi:hypothetical protein